MSRIGSNIWTGLPD